MVDLSVQLGKLKLKNPVIAGAGPLAGTAQHIKNCADAGFGAVCTKTTAYFEAIQRYPRPLYYLADYRKNRDDPYYVPDEFMWMHREHNSIFLPDKFAKIIKEAADYCHKRDCAIIGNIAGRSYAEWERMATDYAEAGCDALELNFCCPMPADMKDMARSAEEARIGIAFTQDPAAGEEVIRRLKKVIDIPLFPKLSPEASGFPEIAKAFEAAGADGITLFANGNVLKIDIETGKPINYGTTAATSYAFKPLTLAHVSRVAQSTNLAIMSGRGATKWQDVIEFMMGGASAVQFVAIIMVRGLGYARRLLEGVETYMERRGYKSPQDFQGAALPHILTTKQIKEQTKALYSEVVYDKCIGCRRCTNVCWYDAIRPLPKKVTIIKEKCVGCILCTQVCPTGAIVYKERESELDHLRALASAHPDLAPEDLKMEKVSK